MYLPDSYGVAVTFMFVTMLSWGSWANASKIDKTWRFELFYWDYSLGVLLTTLLFGFTLGSFGSSGESFLENISHLSYPVVAKALLSGILFNGGNILLVAAISIAGMAVAFPIGIGIALVLGTLLSYWVAPKGNIYLLGFGVLLVLVAIVLDALAYKRAENKAGATPKKGILLSVICGILMSLFYPIIADSMRGEGALTPYTAVFFFAVGLFVCNFGVNTLIMKKPVRGPALSFKDYFLGRPRQHLFGLLGGFVWCVGMSLNVVASTSAGPAVAYAFGQGATLIAALWGVFVWKEFSHAKHVRSLLVFMFLFYLLGLFFIGIAKL